MSILLNITLGIYVIVTLLMILVILMQRPKSEGLGAAFGGGVTDNIFGAQTTNVLTKITGWLAGIFFLLTFGLSVLYAHRTNATSGLRQELMKTEGAAAPATLPQGPDTPAVGAPGSVTNPAPGGDAATGNADGVTPADQAVGATGPSAPLEAPAAPAPEAQPTAQPQP
jgi:preprotein translocase subunit SecG